MERKEMFADDKHLETGGSHRGIKWYVVREHDAIGLKFWGPDGKKWGQYYVVDESKHDDAMNGLKSAAQYCINKVLHEFNRPI